MKGKKMIIAILSLKGGTGKTTVSTTLACRYAKDNKVILVDSDSQRSSMAWYNCREENNPNLTVSSAIEPGVLRKQLPNLSNQYDYVIVDGAPHTDSSNAITLFFADLVLIPITPSPYDYWSVETFINTRVMPAMEQNPSLKVFFLLNKWNERSSLPKSIEEALQENLSIKLLNSRLHNRVAYADSAMYGKTVLEFNNPKAKAEVEALFYEIEAISKKCNV